MKAISRIICVILALSLLLASCSKEEITPVKTEQKSNGDGNGTSNGGSQGAGG